MDALALLDEARAAGLKVRRDGDNLVVVGPPDAGGGATGDPSEHGAGHQPGSAGIVVIEQAADHFAAGIKTRDRVAGGVFHPRRQPE